MKIIVTLSEADIIKACIQYVAKHHPNAGFRCSLRVTPKYDYLDKPTGGSSVEAEVTVVQPEAA